MKFVNSAVLINGTTVGLVASVYTTNGMYNLSKLDQIKGLQDCARNTQDTIIRSRCEQQIRQMRKTL